MSTSRINPKVLRLVNREVLDKGGEPPDDGDMQARVAKLEAAADFIQRDVKDLKDDVRAIRTTDFRLIFAAIIAVALGLAAIMAKGFHWI